METAILDNFHMSGYLHFAMVYDTSLSFAVFMALGGNPTRLFKETMMETSDRKQP
jgi:hypothetical protein